MAAFDDIPLIDNHLHPPLISTAGIPFARFFGEASDADMVAQHVPRTLFFERALRELADLLDCAPDERSVQAARAAIGPEPYLRRLISSANIDALIVDDGYPVDGAMSVDELAVAAGCRTYRVARIESIAEACFPDVVALDGLVHAVLGTLESDSSIVGLKSIIAYRSGLAIEEPNAEAATRAFAEIRAVSGARPPRLTAKPLLDYLLFQALDWAVEHDLPVQLHTGYGDRDLNLALANPALLRPLLEQARFERLKVVLLHAAYPYSREASYLAAVYPRVFVDWSEANPMLSPAQLRRLLEELLALAPYTKVLYGSDAWGIPDWLWLGARGGRSALAAVLADEPRRQLIGRRILRENAAELYGLTG